MYTQGTVNLKVALKALDVQKMVRCPIPTYLIGVDEPSEKAYVVSIHGNLTGKISSMPSTFPLDCNNLKTLWIEVETHWKTFGQTAILKTSAFVI